MKITFLVALLRHLKARMVVPPSWSSKRGVAVRNPESSLELVGTSKTKCKNIPNRELNSPALPSTPRVIEGQHTTLPEPMVDPFGTE